MRHTSNNFDCLKPKKQAHFAQGTLQDDKKRDTLFASRPFVASISVSSLLQFTYSKKKRFGRF